MKITEAQKQHAPIIAKLIMKAMSHECCRYFIDENHNLEDFEQLITRLVEMEESQYSYKNTIVALDDKEEVIGAIVSYDGGRLHELREKFLLATKELFGRDFSDMTEETQEGEIYLDSLAVVDEHQKKGIGTKLMKAAIEKASKSGLPAVGLLVDKDNPKAEKLYKRLGFEYVNDKDFGGHEMRHMQIRF